MQTKKVAIIVIAVIALSIIGTVAYKKCRRSERKIITPTKEDQKLALAAMEECFPQEVFEHLIYTQERLNHKLDPENRLPKNLNAWAIDKNLLIWVALPLKTQNTGPTKTGEISLGGTSQTGPIVIMNETGAILKHKLVKQNRPNFYQLYVKLDEPWESGTEKTFYWVGQYRKGNKLNKNPSGQYTLPIQQHFGPEAIQQLALILPRGWKVVSASKKADSVKQIGDVEITVWAKHVQRNENHKVDVVLAPY